MDAAERERELTSDRARNQFFKTTGTFFVDRQATVDKHLSVLDIFVDVSELKPYSRAEHLKDACEMWALSAIYQASNYTD